jgi:hypothetical protein
MLFGVWKGVPMHLVPENWKELDWFNFEEFMEFFNQIDYPLHDRFWDVVAASFASIERSVLRQKASLGMDVNLPGYLD